MSTNNASETHPESSVPPPDSLTREQWPPNYVSVFEWRMNELDWYAKDPLNVWRAESYYATNPQAFINHWVDTFDPRNAMDGVLPTRLPLIMFKKQDELVSFLVDCLAKKQSGLIDKSRDMGATWICCAMSVWLWRFKPGSAVGWGSRKEQLVDKLGDPSSIFEKLRKIVDGLPPMLLPRGFNRDKHMSYMKIINPANESSITGEAGDNIGRGGRTSIYFKDESAHYEHPESIEAALGDNTDVQIDLSTVHGVGTVFDRKRQAGTIWYPGADIPRGALRVFVMDWRDHPMKDEAWHAMREKKAKDEGLLHVFRQEVDRDAAAAIQGIICPQEWVRAAIDFHLDYQWDDTGGWSGALDVADEGGDLNALTFRKGTVLNYADDWGDGDVGFSTRRCAAEMRQRSPCTTQYDSVGIGAGVKAEANRLRSENMLSGHLNFMPWNAGAAVIQPEARVIPSDANSPKNKDFYANLKAQGWWALRRRFEKVYRIRTEGLTYPVEELISISSKIPKVEQLKRELSQPVAVYDGKLRLAVDKKPEGAKSPNLADSVMMNFFPVKLPMIITSDALSQTGGPRR